MNKLFIRTLSLIILSTTCLSGRAQSIHKSVCGSGFSQTGNNSGSIIATFGQPIVGGVGSLAAHASQGFWAGEDASPSKVKFDQLAPHNLTLLSNAPNPFRSSTTIHFTLASSNDVTLEVYASNGELVNTTHFLKSPAGPNEHVFPRGALPSGNYNYTLTDGIAAISGAMTISR